MRTMTRSPQIQLSGPARSWRTPVQPVPRLAGYASWLHPAVRSSSKLAFKTDGRSGEASFNTKEAIYERRFAVLGRLIILNTMTQVSNGLLYAGNVAAGGKALVEPYYKTESVSFSKQLRWLQRLGVQAPYEVLAAPGDVGDFCKGMDAIRTSRNEIVHPPDLEALGKAVGEAMLFVTPETRALGKAESQACDILVEYEDKVVPILETALMQSRWQ